MRDTSATVRWCFSASHVLVANRFVEAVCPVVKCTDATIAAVTGMLQLLAACCVLLELILPFPEPDSPQAHPSLDLRETDETR